MSTISSATAHPGRRGRRRPTSWGWLCWLTAAVWGLASASIAAEPPSPVRYGRKTAKVQGKEGLEAQLDAARKAADDEAKGPTTTVDPLNRKRQDITLATLDAQLVVARELIEASGPSDKDFPEYLFRYADLQLERKAIFEDQAGALYEDIHALKEGGKTEAARIEVARQKKLRKLAKSASESAAKAYGRLVEGKQWANWKKMDAALYFLAFELGQLGHQSQMQEIFVRLLHDHPTSKYVPQVFISFGDQKFQAGQIGDAQALYEKVVEGYADAPVYAYALYKLAWCHLNPVGTAEPNYPRALQRFVDTIEATLQGRAGSEANGRQLRRDARRDLVLAYVHTGRPSKAWDFFRTVGKGPTAKQDMVREMMVRLAGVYFGEGMYLESSATYHRLQDELPKDADRCNWQYHVVINALASDDKDIQWKETERLGAEWDRMRDTKHGNKTRKKCRDQTRDTLQRMATVWHEEGDKTHRPETFALSDRAYQSFLHHFPGGKDGYQMQYWHAELLWQHAELLYASKDRTVAAKGLAKFRAAHDAFVRTLDKNPKGKFSGEAAFAQMLAMKNYLEYDETGGKGRGCQSQSDGTCVYPRQRRGARNDEKLDAATRFPISDYSDDEKLMLAAYERYDQHAGVAKKSHPEETPKIMFHRAMLMVKHNRFDEARPVLEKLLAEHDGTVFAVWGGEMLIDSLTIAWADTARTRAETIEASETLDTWARKIQKMKLYQHKESSRLKTQIPTLLASVGRRAADLCLEAARAGEEPDGFGKCARKYYAVYEEFDDYDRGDELLFNAAICFEADYQVGNAIRARRALLDYHPDSKLAKQTLREVGENYQAIAYYADAAERYEQFAERYGKDDFAGDALENAFLFRLGLGDQDQATADLERYESLYRRKDPKRAAGIFWAKHDLLEADGAQLEHAEDYIRTYGSKGGADRLVVAHATAGQVLWRKSCPKALVGDVCVSIKRTRATAGAGTRQHAQDLRRRNKQALPNRCGSDTRAVVTVHRRDPKLAAAAQRHFEQALSAAGKAKPPKDDDTRINAFRDAVGKSLVYQTDAAYEDYLRIEMPENLDFHLEDWKKGTGVPRYERQYKAQLARVKDTRKRFDAFFTAKNAKRDELIASYGKVLESNSPQWVLASAARSAVVFQNFADQLYRAEVPRTLKTQDQVDDYCFGLADYAQPLQAAANKALGYCLERSTQHQFFNDFSRMCEEELQQWEPDRYPATNELFGRSAYTHGRLDVAGVQLTLESGVRKDKVANQPKAAKN